MRMTIKQAFRWLNGVDKSHICKECKYCIKYTANRSHYKCQKMGVTSSSATDIRLKDYACRLFEVDDE